MLLIGLQAGTERVRSEHGAKAHASSLAWDASGPLLRCPLLRQVWLNVQVMKVLRLLGQGFTILKLLISDFYYQWAMIYARWGQPVRALWYFNRAVAMNRSGYKAYYNRGLLFVAIGAPERAIGDFTLAIQNKPDHVDARINRSILYTITGRHEQALRDLEQAVEMGADRDFLEQQMMDARTRVGT